MNKTHTVERLSCGCVERRWLFGRDFISKCLYHRWNPRPHEHPKSWGGKAA